MANRKAKRKQLAEAKIADILKQKKYPTYLDSLGFTLLNLRRLIFATCGVHVWSKFFEAYRINRHAVSPVFFNITEGMPGNQTMNSIEARAAATGVTAAEYVGLGTNTFYFFAATAATTLFTLVYILYGETCERYKKQNAASLSARNQRRRLNKNPLLVREQELNALPDYQPSNPVIKFFHAFRDYSENTTYLRKIAMHLSFWGFYIFALEQFKKDENISCETPIPFGIINCPPEDTQPLLYITDYLPLGVMAAWVTSLSLILLPYIPYKIIRSLYESCRPKPEANPEADPVHDLESASKPNKAEASSIQLYSELFWKLSLTLAPLFAYFPIQHAKERADLKAIDTGGESFWNAVTTFFSLAYTDQDPDNIYTSSFVANTLQMFTGVFYLGWGLSSYISLRVGSIVLGAIARAIEKCLISADSQKADEEHGARKIINFLNKAAQPAAFWAALGLVVSGGIVYDRAIKTVEVIGRSPLYGFDNSTGFPLEVETAQNYSVSATQFILQYTWVPGFKPEGPPLMRAAQAAAFISPFLLFCMTTAACCFLIVYYSQILRPLYEKFCKKADEALDKVAGDDHPSEENFSDEESSDDEKETKRTAWWSCWESNTAGTPREPLLGKRAAAPQC